MKTHLILIMALVLLAGSLSAQDNKASVSLTAAIYEEEVTGNLDKAVELYLNILKKYPDDRQVAAKTLYHLGLVNEKMGKQKANEYFARLVSTYPDQTEMVAMAKAKLAALGIPAVSGGHVSRRILSDASQVYGVLNTDGRYISHIDRETGDIVQFDIAKGQTSRILNKEGAADAETPAPYDFLEFLNERKQIVYDWLPKDSIGTPPTQLRIRNLDGSGLRTLYSEKDYYIRSMDLSPDAASILALRRKGREALELTMISTEDGSVHVLRNISEWLFWSIRARFSPDGRFVAFSADGFAGEGNPQHGEVYVMTADGRSEVVVAAHPAEDQLLRWTPDGKSLLFLSDRSGTWDIWTVGINGGKQQGEPELLKKDFGYYSEIIGFAPNGSFYFKTYTLSGGLISGVVDLETGKVIEPPTPVATRYTGYPDVPVWSPDGSSLLYFSRRGTIGPGNNILTIRSADTGEERFLSPPLRYVNSYSWAPDSRSIIAFGLTTGPDNGIFRIDAETSQITRLADKGLCPHICPDGKTLVFVNMDATSIMKRNLDNGEESEVVKVDNRWATNYDLSPDGRKVVYQEGNSLMTVSLNGGEPKELCRGLAKIPGGWGYNLAWSSDGSYIIFWEGTEIWRVSAQGGTPLKLDLSTHRLAVFALNPDNRHFVYSLYMGSTEDLWVLENFLPK